MYKSIPRSIESCREMCFHLLSGSWGFSVRRFFLPALEQNEIAFLFQSEPHGAEHVKPCKTAQVLETHLLAIAYAGESVVASETLVLIVPCPLRWVVVPF